VTITSQGLGVTVTLNGLLETHRCYGSCLKASERFTHSILQFPFPM